MLYFFFFFKQKTAYEMRISDWSSDVCSSDLQVSDDLAAIGKNILVLRLIPQHRHYDDLLRRDDRGHAKAIIVSVRHDHSADQACCNAPACRLRQFQFTLAVQTGRASCRERVCQYG